MATHTEIESVSRRRQRRCDTSRIMGHWASSMKRKGESERAVARGAPCGDRTQPALHRQWSCDTSRITRHIHCRSPFRVSSAGLEPASAGLEDQRLSARPRGRCGPGSISRFGVPGRSRTCVDRLRRPAPIRSATRTVGVRRSRARRRAAGVAYGNRTRLH